MVSYEMRRESQVTASDHSEQLKNGDKTAGGRLSRIFVVLVLLAGAGSLATLLWTPAVSASFRSLVAATAGPFVAEKPIKGDTDSLHQQIAALTQSHQQMMAAQQAEIKRLTDQVANLSGKLDQLRRPVASAPTAISPVKSTALAPRKVEIPKPVTRPAERELFDTKPTGAISTGGAPLPSEPLTTPRPTN